MEFKELTILEMRMIYNKIGRMTLDDFKDSEIKPFRKMYKILEQEIERRLNDG